MDGARIFFFLIWCNLLPPVAAMIWGERYAAPLDRGRAWLDGRPLFGPHKTLRGVLAGLVGGTLVFPLFALPWFGAAIAAGLVILGDLLSSFIKRRGNLPSGTPVFGLDQIFEGLFPALYLAWMLDLDLRLVAVALALFIPMAYGASRLWNFLVYRPSSNYPRIIRSAVRLREWRACHQPLARWQRWFNFSNFILYRIIISGVFKATGLYRRGVANALDIQDREHTFYFPSLPEAFDGFTILLLTDLHLDGLDALPATVGARLRNMPVDLCLIGGDIRMEVYGAIAPSVRRLKELLAHVRSRHGILGVLGNHDCIEMVPDLEEAGVVMLVNDHCPVEQNGSTIWVVGVDDPNYYKVHDPRTAFRGVPEGGFSIFLAHSPEVYDEVVDFAPRLYLCGHTHGGQVCLPDRGPIFTHSRAPRFTARGPWEHKGMQGFTSCGVGASGVPIRFHCPGEIVRLTLKRGSGPATDHSAGGKE